MKKKKNQKTITDDIRSRIARGVYIPGSALSEAALAEEFEVSRTPIREALKQLQAEGLVVVRPRVGTFVFAPTRLEVNELFEVKEILEGAAARLFANRGNIPELELLKENVRKSEHAVANQDLDQYVELVHEYHDLIMRGAGNSKLMHLYHTLMNQLLHSQFVHLTVRSSGRAPQSDHEHHSILEVIEARDGNTAERLMRDHVRASHQALMEVLEFSGQGSLLNAASSPAPEALTDFDLNGPDNKQDEAVK
ncbi:GntR family transcriptional regulator [Hoeflea sp. CAU 1731]